MKKIITIVLVFAMLLGLAACGAEDPNKKSAGVMTYQQYMDAPMDSEVTIECYVMATQSWWQDTINVYAQDGTGGYFIYNLACSEADAAKLTQGTKIKVKGYKSEWSGEIEVVDGTFEFGKGSWTAPVTDVSDKLGKDELANYMNQYVSFKGMKVESEALYKWDGSGTQGDDLYFNVSLGGNTYSFTVESYLCGSDTEVYKTVEGLKVGDTVDMEGFLYWYEGPNPHITKVTVK
jgi:hypothetical protein